MTCLGIIVAMVAGHPDPTVPPEIDARGAIEAVGKVWLLNGVPNAPATEIGLPYLDAGVGLSVSTPRFWTTLMLNPDFSDVPLGPGQLDAGLRTPLFVAERRERLQPWRLAWHEPETFAPRVDALSIARGRELEVGVLGPVEPVVELMYTPRIAAPVALAATAGEWRGHRVAGLYAADSLNSELGGGTAAHAVALRFTAAPWERLEVGGALTQRTFEDGSRSNTVLGTDLVYRGLGPLVLRGAWYGSHTYRNVARIVPVQQGFSAFDATLHQHEFLWRAAANRREHVWGSLVQLDAEFRQEPFFWRGAMRDLTADFDAAMGFVPRRDYRMFTSEIGLTLRPGLPWLSRVEPAVRYARVSDRDELGLFDDTLQDDELHLDVEADLAWLTVIATGGYRQSRFLTVTAGAPYAALGVAASVPDHLRVQFRVDEGYGWYFDAADPFFGPKHGMILDAEVVVASWLDMQSRVSVSLLERPGLERIALAAWIARGVLRLHFYERVSLRVIGEVNGERGITSAQVVLAYEPAPGCAVSIGASGADPWPDAQEPRDGANRLVVDAKLDVQSLFQQLFAKIAWSW